MGRTLVGGVGHYHLCDFSVGPALSERLAAEAWPDDVVVEDLSYGPVVVWHRLTDEQPPFERWVLFGATRRDRAPGTITAYRWDGVLPGTEEIQARVAEAVGGTVDLDSLVIIAAALGGAPSQTCVIEIEPLIEEVGERMSAPVERACEQTRALVRSIVAGTSPPLPNAPLGG